MVKQNIQSSKTQTLKLRQWINNPSTYNPRPMGHVITMYEASKMRIEETEKAIRALFLQVQESLMHEDVKKAKDQLNKSGELLNTIYNQNLAERHESLTLKIESTANALHTRKVQETEAAINKASRLIEAGQYSLAENALNTISQNVSTVDATLSQRFRALEDRLEEYRQTQMPIVTHPEETTYETKQKEKDSKSKETSQEVKIRQRDECPDCGTKGELRTIEASTGRKTIGAVAGVAMGIAGFFMLPFIGVGMGPLAYLAVTDEKTYYKCPKCGKEWENN